MGRIYSSEELELNIQQGILVDNLPVRYVSKRMKEIYIGMLLLLIPVLSWLLLILLSKTLFPNFYTVKAPFRALVIVIIFLLVTYLLTYVYTFLTERRISIFLKDDELKLVTKKEEVTIPFDKIKSIRTATTYFSTYQFELVTDERTFLFSTNRLSVESALFYANIHLTLEWRRYKREKNV